MATALKEVFTARVDLAPPISVGKVPEGYRRVIPILGGHFTGERLHARVLPIGADWNIVRPNGMGFLSARYLLETDDGVTISILNEGCFRADENAIEDVIDGEVADSSRWYVKLNPRFEAPRGEYEWLNRSTFVCDLHPITSPEFIAMTFYEVV
jgi:hypothetical protein